MADNLVDYGPLKLQQLQLAHGSTVLFYIKMDARDKEGSSKRLALKLRPEFGRLYLSDDIKECFKLLSRSGVDDGGVGGSSGASSGGIDIAVLDFDVQSMKFLDAINKRTTAPATGHLPGIATVVILPMDDSDAGGAGSGGGSGGGGGGTKRLGLRGGEMDENDPRHDPRQLIANHGGCNAVLARSVSSKQMLYTLLDALHRRRLVEMSYKDVRIVKSVSAKYPFFPIFANKAHHHGGADDDEGGDEGDDEEGGGSGSDEGSPKQAGSTTHNNNHHADGGNVSVSSGGGSTVSLKTLTDWTDSSSMLPVFVKEQRKAAREKRGGGTSAPDMKELKERHALDRSILLQDDDGVGEREWRRGSHQHLAGEPPHGPGDDVSHVSETTKESSAKRLAAAAATLKPIAAAKSQLCTHLLDPRRRPTWKTPSRRPRGGGQQQLQQQQQQQTLTGDDDFPSQAPAAAADDNDDDDDDVLDPEDVKKFYSKRVPDLQVLHSVGGLDRRLIDVHWKVLHASQHADPKSRRNQKASATAARGGDTSLSDSSLASFLPAVMSSSLSLDGGDKEHKDQARGHVHDSRAMDLATKTLKRLARDCPPDVQVHNLIDVELTHGKVSVGDRDLLESGLKLEHEGLNDQAIVIYIRAGLHSKSPHLSRVFLGNIHFRMGKYMAALKFFTEALQLLDECRHTAQYNLDDHFCSTLNRGVTNFRVGDDEQGLLDVEKAVAIYPDHLKAREILAIAQRRMNMYKATIEGCKRNKVLREEAALAADEAALTAAEKSAKRRGGLGGNGGGSRSLPSSSASTAAIPGAHINANTNSVSSLGDFSSVADTQPSMKTVYFSLGDPAGVSMQDRKVQAKRLVIESNASGAAPGEALKTFKVLNGFPLDLYEGLFVKPSSLQDALAVVPEKRTMEMLDVICSTLRLVPFLRVVPDKIILEVARCVEYRTIANKGTLFEQNDPCDGVCFLLRGTMQARLDFGQGEDAISSHSIGDVPLLGAVGHTDLLFRNHNSSLVRSLYKMCSKQKKDLSLSADASTTMMTAPAAVGAGMMSMSRVDEATASKFAAAATPLAPFPPHCATGDGVDADEPLSDDELEESQLPRALRKGMFTTYAMTSICELLLLREADFQRLLYKYAHEDLQRRLDIIRASCVFSTWRHEDVVRLARMGRVQTFRSGELILSQGDQPSFLYLMMKGMCKTYKRPNKTEILDKKLTEARDKAERHDLKYAFQANLRHTLSKSNMQQQQMLQSIGRNQHLTAAEVDRHLLGLHIAHLEHDLARERILEARKLEEEVSRDEEKESITATLVEVSTLQWPMLFGESCVQDPEKGFSRGTIIADTTCDIFMVHKTQIQTFRVTSNLIDRVTSHAVNYPSDEVLVATREKKEQWESQRLAVVDSLQGPRDDDQNLEPFYV